MLGRDPPSSSHSALDLLNTTAYWQERELVSKSRAYVSEKTSALIHLEDDAGFNRGALPLAPSSQSQRCV